MNRHTPVRRAVRRLARAWADIDHAQRRVFELQTGVRVTGSRRTR